MKKFVSIVLMLFCFIAIGSGISLDDDPVQFVEETEIGSNYVVYIDTNIDDPKVYRGLISFLDSLKEGDQVKFKLISYGGRGDSTFYIYNAILRCKAKTIAEIQVAMSGGSIIAMACEEIIINKFSVMLVHGPQGFLGGSILGIYKGMRVDIEFFKSLLTSVYESFITEDQLRKVLDGEDVTIYEKELKELLKKWKPINVKTRNYKVLKKLKLEQKKKEQKEIKESNKKAQQEADKLEKIFNELDKALK